MPGHLPGLRFRVAEDPGGVADREPRPIGDHVGYLGGVQAAVTGVDVLDDLLAAPGLQVEVDVRRARLLQGQEPFEEQAVPERVDGGDAEDVADHAAGGRAPALAPDPLFGGVPDDVVDDQEVAREPEPGDQVEFVVELPPGRSRPRVDAGAVAADAGGLRAVPQPRVLRVPGGHGELRQLGAQFAEVDDTGAAQGDGGVRDARIP